MRLRYIPPRVFKESSPPRAQQNDIPGADLYVVLAFRSRQVLWSNSKILRQGISALATGDVKQNTASQNWRHGVNRMLPDAGSVSLHIRGSSTAEQLSSARKMTQRVDMCARVAAHRNGIRRRTHAVRTNEITVFLRQSEQE